MIAVKNIIKYYGNYQALKDISFNINKGEIVGLLGPNGAGKSTTMRILTGYIPATSGQIFVDNYEVHEKSHEVKKLIGYMPENISLYMDMRVYDYLYFCAKLKSIPRTQIKKRIDHVIEMIGLGERRSFIIGNLSKGYRQRVGLAQAILHEPAILVLDEPTVGLDPNQIIEIRNLIKGLSGERTVILSTHILSEVEETCQKVIIIKTGNIIAENNIPTLKKIVDNEIKSGNIELIVKDKSDEAIGLLRSMPSIRYANLDKDTNHISITTEGKEDIRSTIIKKLVDSNFEVLEMKSKALSLEEVFLHFTTKGTTAEANTIEDNSDNNADNNNNADNSNVDSVASNNGANTSENTNDDINNTNNTDDTNDTSEKQDQAVSTNTLG